jgi:hypothetical protein
VKGDPTDADQDTKEPPFAPFALVLKAGKKDGTVKTSEVRLQDLSEENQERVRRRVAVLRSLVDSKVTLISRDPRDTPDLSLAIGTTPAGKVTGPFVTAVLFDSKLQGETNSRPRFRLPPFQMEELKIALEAVRSRRERADAACPDDQLPTHDVYMFLDAGREGICTQMVNYFRSRTTVQRSIYVMYDPESVEQRRDRARSFGALAQTECLRIVAHKWPAAMVQTRTRKYYKGSSAQNGICGVPVVPKSELWNLTWAEKKQVFSPLWIIRAGGRPPEDPWERDDGEEVPEESSSKRTDSTVEPVFFHSTSPVSLWEEVIHSYGINAVLDLTPGEGLAAVAALKAKVPYTGVCFTLHHVAALKEHLYEVAQRAATREGDSLYDPELTTALQGKVKKRSLDLGDKTPRKKTKNG